MNLRRLLTTTAMSATATHVKIKVLMNMLPVPIGPFRRRRPAENITITMSDITYAASLPATGRLADDRRGGKKNNILYYKMRMAGDTTTVGYNNRNAFNASKTGR